jgi:hypothetical protein
MRLFAKGLSAFSLSLVLTLGTFWQASAQDSASASVKPPSKIERPPSMNQGVTKKKQQEPEESLAQGKPPPCDQKANPKCKNPTPSKHSD